MRSFYGQPGDLIFKPRGQWHTFWNAGDEPARILEMISPAGFERYFEQMVDLLEQSAGAPGPSELAAIAAQHGLEVDRESIPRLTEKYGLRWLPSLEEVEEAGAEIDETVRRLAEGHRLKDD